MEKNNLYLIIVAVIICVVIGCISPFIASSNPDGLEKSAENLNVSETDAVLESPFPDYSFEALGIGGEIIVLILGVIVTLLAALGLGFVLRKRDS